MLETILSVEDYLKGDFRPDVDYVDGHVEERHFGEKSHGKLVIRLTNLLNAMAGVFAFAETRVNVRASRYRVPDVCAYKDREPEEEVFTRPPFLCIEVLSPEDRISRMMQVVKDYFEMGVQHVWIVDPRGDVYLCDGAGGWKTATDGLGTSDGRISLSSAEIFGAYGTVEDVVEPALSAVGQRAESGFDGTEDELEKLLLEGLDSGGIEEGDFWSSVDRITNAMLVEHNCAAAS